MSGKHAEDYRGFLLYLLREVWNAQGPYDVYHAAETLNGNGLYFLFWSAYKDADDIDKQDQIYPLYVGITGRTFKQRFKEHIDHGVVRKITTGQWPKEEGIVDLPLIAAYVMDMPLPVAKFFESVFLYSFDFAMNVEENGGERAGIQITKSRSVEYGYGHFKEGYEHIKSYFSDIDKMVSHEEMENAVQSMFHYNFKG